MNSKADLIVTTPNFYSKKCSGYFNQDQKSLKKNMQFTLQFLVNTQKKTFPEAWINLGFVFLTISQKWSGKWVKEISRGKLELLPPEELMQFQLKLYFSLSLGNTR